MRRAVWVVGEPGIGKTSLLREFLPKPWLLLPKPKWTYCGSMTSPSVVAAGHYSGATFDGADTVPYNGVAGALAWWSSSLQTPLTIFDGDRFSNVAVVEFARNLGVECLVLKLEAATGVAAYRRQVRGSSQNQSWLKGRATKSARFADSFVSSKRLVLDSSHASPQDLARQFGNWLNLR